MKQTINNTPDYDKSLVRFTRSKIKSIFISPNKLDINEIRSKIITKFKLNTMYSVIFKVKYNDDQFGMLSPQEGLILESVHDTEPIDKLYKEMIKSLDRFMEEYSVEYFDLIQLIFIIIEDSPKLKVKNIDNIYLNKEFLNVNKERFSYSSRLLPLTTNVNFYGKLIINKEKHNYLDLINKEKDKLLKNKINVSDVDTLYLYRDEYLIVNAIKSTHKVDRVIYSAATGKHLDSFTDLIHHDGTFTRTKGNLELTISDDKVLSLCAEKPLSIMKYKHKGYAQRANTMIGSFGFNTYRNINGYLTVYAIGFKTLSGQAYCHYISDDKDSNNLILGCIDMMLSHEYHNHIFYVDDFSKHGSLLILKALKEANIGKGLEHYKLDPIYRDDKLFMLTIKTRGTLSNKKQNKVGVRKEPPFIKISLVDSRGLLNEKLSNLIKPFDVESINLYFPDRFVNEDTLWYRGNMPSINYWDNISNTDYHEKFNDNWDLKEECLKSLHCKLDALVTIMKTFSKYIFKVFDIEITDSPTISSLALNIYLKDYINKSELPIIKSNMYMDIRNAYYGGICEIYKPHGKNLFYYDVNSLYPHSSLNPMPGRVCKYMESFEEKGLVLDEIFGFVYCAIETMNDYLGLLPVRSLKGVFNPVGKWSGWYFSEEVKFARDQGYYIKVARAYHFNRSYNVFDKYVNDIYKIKSSSEGHEKVIAKGLLNHLYGRLGMGVHKAKTEIVNGSRLAELQSTRVFESYPKQITNDDYLISYFPLISSKICSSHGKDYIEYYSTGVKDMESNKQYTDISLTTAASVTAYARIYMSKIKMEMLDKGANIYYTDTDSLVLDKPLPDKLVGNELGKFKLVHSVKEAYFATSKTYCLVLQDDTTVVKSKKATGKQLSLEDFMDIYKRSNTVNNTIEDKQYATQDEATNKLNLGSYKKRILIFHNDVWVDTRPLVYVV